MNTMSTYKVHEIFYSLQGEGHWMGTPMIFVRFFGCNLTCKWCDTPQVNYREMTAREIHEEVDSLNPSAPICFTGGEPLLQLDEVLINEFRGQRFIHLETNGTLPLTLPLTLGWVTVSPKPGQELKINLGSVNEFRFPYEPKLEEWILKNKVMCMTYISPINNGLEINWKNVHKAVDFCKKHPELKLSLQLHKLIGIK